MSRQNIAAHYARLLTRWPKDILRPEHQFSAVLQHRSQAPPVPFRDEGKEVNAAYILLDNTISRQFPIQERLLKPDSNPQHYENLKRELEDLPNRTWLSNLGRRLRGMVRFR